jgi:hypothetical protein
MEDELNVEGLAPADELLPADVAEQDEGEAQLGEDPAAAAEEGEGAPPKPKNSAQERIDELTRARREAERRAERAERELHQARNPQPAPQAPQEPNPANYQYGEADAGFIRDLAAFSARQAFAAEAERHSAQTQAQAVEKTWNDRQVTYATSKPDYFDVIEGEWACSVPMADAIRTSDDGPAVAYHLASHPEEARRIAGLNPLAQIREIGRLEAKLAQPVTPSPPLKIASDAPAPAPTVRGQGGRFKVAPDTTDFAAFEKAYGGS